MMDFPLVYCENYFFLFFEEQFTSTKLSLKVMCSALNEMRKYFPYTYSMCIYEGNFTQEKIHYCLPPRLHSSFPFRKKSLVLAVIQTVFSNVLVSKVKIVCENLNSLK
jgi:hypothetical protein